MKNLIADVRRNAHTYGSLPFWSWNDKLEPEELRRQIRRMLRRSVFHDIRVNVKRRNVKWVRFSDPLFLLLLQKKFLCIKENKK